MKKVFKAPHFASKHLMNKHPTVVEACLANINESIDAALTLRLSAASYMRRAYFSDFKRPAFWADQMLLQQREGEANLAMNRIASKGFTSLSLIAERLPPQLQRDSFSHTRTGPSSISYQDGGGRGGGGGSLGNEGRGGSGGGLGGGGGQKGMMRSRYHSDGAGAASSVEGAVSGSLSNALGSISSMLPANMQGIIAALVAESTKAAVHALGGGGGGSFDSRNVGFGGGRGGGRGGRGGGVGNASRPAAATAANLPKPDYGSGLISFEDI